MCASILWKGTSLIWLFAICLPHAHKRNKITSLWCSLLIAFQPQFYLCTNSPPLKCHKKCLPSKQIQLANFHKSLTNDTPLHLKRFTALTNATSKCHNNIISEAIRHGPPPITATRGAVFDTRETLRHLPQWESQLSRDTAVANDLRC